MSEPTCRWNGEQRVTARHERECVTSGCEGCAPCQDDHCRCGRHLRLSEPLTCARCVGKVRDDLQRIEDLCLIAPTAATERGIDSAAMLLAGPVPEHSTHAARRAWAHGGALCRCRGVCLDDEPMPIGPLCKKAAKKDECSHYACRRIGWRPTCPGLVSWLEYADDERHPLWVLGTWDMLVAEHLEHERRNRVTVDTAAAYLRSNLTYLAQDRDFAFDELAREVRSCREHVEQVLAVAEHVQRGAPCPTCRAEGRPMRPLERAYADSETDARDEWICSAKGCSGRYSLDEYGKVVYLDHLAHADRLTAEQIRVQYRVSEATVRQWVVRGKVHRRGKDQAGRMLYDVAEVVAARDGAVAS